MTIEDLRTKWWTEPFEPFVVVMDDGRRVPVVKREYFALGPLGRTIAVATPDNDMHVLTVAGITDLEQNGELAEDDIKTD